MFKTGREREFRDTYDPKYTLQLQLSRYEKKQMQSNEKTAVNRESLFQIT